jgi:hypothetical protein
MTALLLAMTFFGCCARNDGIFARNDGVIGEDALLLGVASLRSQ